MKQFGLFFLLMVWQLAAIGQNTVRVSKSIPPTGQAGQWLDVKLRIDKSDLICYAQFEQILPEGTQVQVLEYAGAEDRMEGNKLIFTWLRFPPESILIVHYKLRIPEAIGNKLTLSGRLNYQIQNHLGTALMPVHVVQVSGGTGKQSSNQTSGGQQTDPQKEQTAAVNAWRELSAQNANYQVNVHLSKGNLTGSARLTENLPDGYFARPDELQGANMSIQNNQLILAWRNLPENDKLNIQYTLIKQGNAEGNQPALSGTFTYQNAGQTKSLMINTRKPDEDDERVNDALNLWGN